MRQTLLETEDQYLKESEDSRRMKSGRASKGMDDNMKFLGERWGSGEYKLVLGKIELTKS